MGIIFEIILYLVIEIVIPIIGELLISFGFESFSSTFREYKIVNKYLAITGCILLGGIFGLITYAIYPLPIVENNFFPGISLIISPLIVGLVMKKFGEFRMNAGKRISILLTFRGGAAFAFSFALVRFLLIRY